MNPILFDKINTRKMVMKGQYGLPEHYPSPPRSKDLLFYIQRNQNLNTVVYELNRLHDGRINEEYPMHIYWIRYSENKEIQELNYIQNELAYGYNSNIINHESFEFEMVSYKALKMYIGKNKHGNYSSYALINNVMSYLTNIYVYAEDFGLFPDVKYFELYGKEIEGNNFVYEKIYI